MNEIPELSWKGLATKKQLEEWEKRTSKRAKISVIRKKIAKLGLDPNELSVFSQAKYRE